MSIEELRAARKAETERQITDAVRRVHMQGGYIGGVLPDSTRAQGADSTRAPVAVERKEFGADILEQLQDYMKRLQMDVVDNTYASTTLVSALLSIDGVEFIIREDAEGCLSVVQA